ncbi:MAG: hypothetical protein Fur0027_24000 [Raineya sp.]
MEVFVQKLYIFCNFAYFVLLNAKYMSKKFISILTLAVLASCSGGGEAEKSKQVEQDTNKVLQDAQPMVRNQYIPDLVDILNTSDNFSLFTSYLNTNLSEMLSKGEYTILAPTNKAIEKLGEAQMTKMLNKGEDFVKNHIVKGSFDVPALKKTSEITTLQGKKLTVSVEGENITIGNIKVVAADIYAKNGVIHALEGVIE